MIMKVISLLVLSVVITMLGCTYDPVNYDKIHDKEFEDHLKQNGE
ncbi:hypothetical protein [Acinetobacter seifertii]|nr:hypothetical protein [Acinetobacter seifertii]